MRGLDAIAPPVFCCASWRAVMRAERNRVSIAGVREK